MTSLPEPYQYLDGVVAQVLGLPDLPSAVTLAGTNYRRRSHLHCTVVAIKKLVPQIMAAGNVSQEAAEQQVLQAVAAALTAAKPRLTGFTTDLRIAVLPEEHKQSVVIMARVEGFVEFFTALNAALHLQQPVQPAHVTLFAVEDRPIGLNSPEDLAARTRPFTPLELDRWKDQLNTTKVLGVAL